MTSVFKNYLRVSFIRLMTFKRRMLNDSKDKTQLTISEKKVDWT